MEEFQDSSDNNLSVAYEVEQEQQMKCLICYCGIDDTEIVICSCTHTFCKRCLNDYLEYKKDNSVLLPIKCPEPKCSADIFRDYKHLLYKEEYRRLKGIRKAQETLRMRGVVWCDRRSCGGYGIVPMKKATGRCNKCGNSVQHASDPERRFIMEDFPITECPGCRALVYKEWFCMTATCWCGTRFCLKCGDSRPKHHQLACMVRAKGKRISWWIILMLIYAYVTFPLIPALLILYYHYYWGNTGVQALKKHPTATTVLLFIASPLLLVLAAVWLPVKFGWMCVDCLFDSNSLHPCQKLLKTLIFIPTIPIIFVGIVFAFAMIVVFMPIYGIYLMHLVLF